MADKIPPNSTKTTPVSLPEHTDLIRRVCAAISSFFEPTKVTVHQVKISDEVLRRSAAEVLARASARNGRRKHRSPESNEVADCDSHEEPVELTY